MNAPRTTAQESRTPRILQTRVSDTLYATILESETHLILHHRNREITPLILPYHSLDNPHRTAPELKTPLILQYQSPEHISCYKLDLIIPLCGHTTARNTPHTAIPSPKPISCYNLDLIPVIPLCGHTTVRNTPHTMYDTRVR